MRDRLWLFAINVCSSLAILESQSNAQDSTQITEEIIGRIIFSSGEVVIERSNGSLVPAVNCANIYAGDVLVTGADGNLQIRFIDSAVVLLRCDSRSQIASYQYQDSNSDNVNLYLQQGNLRTMTGKIQRSNYQLLTDIAAIKPGGTDYEVALVAPFKAFFGVYDGAITITKMLGELELGSGNGFSFGRADDIEAPTALAVQPPELGVSGILQPYSVCQG